MFWLGTRVSFSHGHFLLHLTITHTSDGVYRRDVYGLSPIGLILWLLIVSLYWGFLMGRPGGDNGQTIGMRRTGIRVVSDDGHEVTALRAILRFLAQAVLWVVFFLPGLLDSLWPLWEHENRTLHDLLCRTHVVRTGPQTRTWSP